MLGKRPKYIQANIIQDKTSKYDTNRMGEEEPFFIYIYIYVCMYVCMYIYVYISI